MFFDKAVEAAIQEAIQRGEFDHLAGAGRPIDLTTYFNAPEEVRAAYAMLKDAGILPREAELLREIADLKKSLSAQHGDDKRQEISRQIERKRVEFNVLMERNRKNR